jgi:hypothetical protein
VFRSIPPSGKVTTIRDFDWYRRDGGSLVQNWVPIDLIDIFLQLGVNLFDRMNEQIKEQKTKPWDVFVKIGFLSDEPKGRGSDKVSGTRL